MTVNIAEKFWQAADRPFLGEMGGALWNQTADDPKLRYRAYSERARRFGTAALKSISRAGLQAAGFATATPRADCSRFGFQIYFKAGRVASSGKTFFATIVAGNTLTLKVRKMPRPSAEAGPTPNVTMSRLLNRAARFGVACHR